MFKHNTACRLYQILWTEGVAGNSMCDNYRSSVKYVEFYKEAKQLLYSQNTYFWQMPWNHNLIKIT